MHTEFQGGYGRINLTRREKEYTMRISVPVMAVVLALSIVIIPSVLTQNALASDSTTHRDSHGGITILLGEFIHGFIDPADGSDGPPPGSSSGPPPEEPKPEENKGYDYIAQWDKNGDGKVSRSEFKGSPGQFDALDKNKNGYISRKEARDISPDMMFEESGPEGAGGHGGRGGHEGYGESSGPSPGGHMP